MDLNPVRGVRYVRTLLALAANAEGLRSHSDRSEGSESDTNNGTLRASAVILFLKFSVLGRMFETGGAS